MPGGGAVAGKSSKMISPAVPASARGRPGRRQAVVGRRRRRRRVIGADNSPNLGNARHTDALPLLRNLVHEAAAA